MTEKLKHEPSSPYAAEHKKDATALAAAGADPGTPVVGATAPGTIALVSPWRQAAISTLIAGAGYLLIAFFSVAVGAAATEESAAGANAGTHDHATTHDHAAMPTDAEPAGPEKRFAVTPELKAGMEQIRDLIRGLHKKIKKNPNEKTEVEKSADKFTEAVNKIFATCKLPPDADAALHPLLAKILDAATDFKAGDFEKGHEKIHAGLSGYGQTFDHPGWMNRGGQKGISKDKSVHQSMPKPTHNSMDMTSHPPGNTAKMGRGVERRMEKRMRRKMRERKRLSNKAISAEHSTEHGAEKQGAETPAE